MDTQRPIVGRMAPDFTLPCTSLPGSDRQQVSLSDYREKWVILVFYPRDFSLVCPTELSAISGRMEEFRRRGCEVLGISTDSIQSHESWVRMPRGQGGLAGLQFPLASDEKGDTSRTYGVLMENLHVALRGLFIIDPNGVLQFQVVHNLSVGRRTDELFRILAALQTGGDVRRELENGGLGRSSFGFTDSGKRHCQLPHREEDRNRVVCHGFPGA